MKMKIKELHIWILMLCLFGATLLPLNCLSQQTKLISFELKDQFKREYTENSWTDSILLFLGSDKTGSKYNPIWAKAIYDSIHLNLPKFPLQQVGVANLSSVPFFLKGFIRNKFPDDREKWTLMDWDGTFSKTYNLVAKKCNILIFDRRRVLVYKTSVKELDKIKLREILAILRKLNE